MENAGRSAVSPGPFRVTRQTVTDNAGGKHPNMPTHIEDARGRAVARLYSFDPAVEADGALLSAAPELLDAVRELLATHPAAYRTEGPIDNRTDAAVRVARALLGGLAGERER